MTTSRVIYSGDACILEINGQPALPYGYMSYQPDEADCAMMRVAGIKLFFLPVYAGDRGINPESGTRPFYSGFWIGDEKYDFTAAQKLFHDTIGSEKPGEVYVIPRVMLEPPLFWEKAHPEELARDFAGTSVHQSYSSEVWLSDGGKALDAFCRWLRKSGYDDYVAGIHIAAGHTEEFMRPITHPLQMTDYSECSKKAWQRFLKRKYGTEAALSLSWDTVISSFDDIAVPTPARRICTNDSCGTRDRQVSDYYRFHSEETAGAICALAKAAKRALGDNRVVGAFYAYCGAERGHTAVDLIMHSPYVDFFASPFSYKNNRPAAGDWAIGGPIDSCSLHGKLWFMENDVRTHLSRPLSESMPRAVPAGGGSYYSSAIWTEPEEKVSVWQLKKALGKVLSHGAALWWFDMWGGWYRSGAYQDFHRRAAKVYAEVLNDFHFSAQTAVICDHSADETQVSAPDRCDALDVLAHTGAAFRRYEMSDLALVSTESYRALILINVYRLSQAQNSLIHAWMNKGRSIIAINCHAFRPGEAYTVQKRDGVTVHVYSDSQIFEFAGCPDAKAIREALLLAGVHIYSFTNDIIYACEGMVTVNAVTGGMKKLFLPRRGTLTDAFTGEKLTPSEHFTYFTMEEGETRVFIIKED